MRKEKCRADTIHDEIMGLLAIAAANGASLVEMSEKKTEQPYSIEVDQNGCSCCGEGKTWTVCGPEDIWDSVSFGGEDGEEEAQNLADKLNDAYFKGTQSRAPDPRVERGDAKKAKTTEEAWKIQDRQEGKPHGWVQWKGTNACIDFHCSCGESSHYDGDFAYHLECPACGRTYFMNGHIEAIELELKPEHTTQYPDISERRDAPDPRVRFLELVAKLKTPATPGMTPNEAENAYLLQISDLRQSARSALAEYTGTEPGKGEA